MTVPYVPGLEGVPVAKSAISFVDGEKGLLEYRGFDIADLAGHCTFEEVAFLLLSGRMPDAAELQEFSGQLRPARVLPEPIVRFIRDLPAEGHPMAALQASVAAAGMCEPPRGVDSDGHHWAVAVRMIAQVPTMVAAFARQRRRLPPVAPDPDLPHAANFLYLLTGQRPAAELARVLDTCLVLHADHTMNASTFAGRVVGSTLATPHATISAAIGALSGPLHGGANAHVLQMLRDIPSVDDVEAAITAKVQAKQKIMGFGHRVYKTFDPRAAVLRRLAERLLKSVDSDTLRIALRTEEVVTRLLGPKGIHANVDFYSGLVYDHLGIESDLFTAVFAVARVSGWTAHWLEQLQDNRIFRPRQIYTGAHGVTVQRRQAVRLEH
jgi:citrate synthase